MTTSKLRRFRTRHSTHVFSVSALGSLATGAMATGALAWGACVLAPAAAAQKGAPPEHKALPDKELVNVAKQFAEWEQAKARNEGSFEVQEDLEKELAKAAKKLGGDGKSFDAILAHPWSMSRALWLAADYEGKASKQRKDFGKVTEQDAGNDVKFALWVPNKYAAKGNGYPLLLCIADEGRKPETHIMEDWVEGSIRDNFLIASPIMPGNGGEWLEDGGVKAVMFTLRHVRDNYAIDFDRIFIGGRGRGVETAQAIAARFPDQFAGVFGWAGDTRADVDVLNFRNIPCYFAGGGANASQFQESAKAAKIETVTLQQDGKAHDIGVWATAQRRNPYPAHVSLVQKNQAPTNAYWVTIPKIDADLVTLEAKVDRATNTITLEGVGVDSATLLLNDAVVDLSKGITVIANGVETKFTEGRKMSQSLELWVKGRNDGGRYFVVTRNVPLLVRAAPVDPAKQEPKDAPKDGGNGGSGEPGK
jgi:hypothetical protein